MITTMKHEIIEQGLKQCASIHLSQGQAFLSDWKKGLKESLQNLSSIHRHFLKTCDALAKANPRLEQHPTLLEDVIQKQIDWLQSFYSTVQDIPANDRIRQYQNEIDDQIRSVCRKNVDPNPTDKHPENESKNGAEEEIEAFLRLHLEAPISEAFLKLSTHLLPGTAKIFHQLHREGEDWIESSLDAGKSDAGDEKPSAIEILQTASPAIDKHVAQLDRIEKEALDAFEADCRKALEEAQQLLIEVAKENQTDPIEKKEGLSDFEAHRLRLEAEAKKLKEGWHRHFEAEQDDWRKDLELALLLVRVRQAHMESKQAIQAKIEKVLAPKFQEASDLITRSLKKFNESEAGDAGNAQLKSMILSESRSMLRSLRREVLPQISALLDQGPLLKNLENCHSRILHAVEKLSETHWLLVKADWDTPVPNPKVSEIHLKTLVQEEACQELETAHRALLTQVEAELSLIDQNVSEFDALVEYNLESGLDLLASDEALQNAEPVRNEIIEGLERALRQLETLMVRSRAIARIIEENRESGFASFQDQIRALGQNEKILELKVRLAKAKTVEQARSYQEKLLDQSEETLSSARSLATKQWDKLKALYARARGFAGLPSTSTTGEESLSRFVLETRKKFAELPYVYQRLFRVEALADSRFFEGQQTHLAALKTSFEAWRNGEAGMTMIVGEKGSGRTSLINAAVPKLYHQVPFLKISLHMQRPVSEDALLQALGEGLKMPEAATLYDLEEQILSGKERKIVCVEDIQNLFLRTVDGFEALERFLLFMSRTCDTIYWLNTCTLYSWRYLDKTLNIATFFEPPHFLDRLSREEIETIILKRHRVSGYGLVFDAAAKDSNSKKETKGDDLQDTLKSAFFNRLATLADGNISVALHFWLAAIQKIEDHTLTLSPEIKMDPSSLFRIANDELFTLAALLHHEGLNVEEHLAIFRFEKQKSLILLGRMEKKGIVVRKTDAYFQINPILYRPIVHALKMRNILH